MKNNEQKSENDMTLTNRQGHPITDNQNIRTVENRGLSTLENYHFIEKISHFDREKFLNALFTHVAQVHMDILKLMVRSVMNRSLNILEQNCYKKLGSRHLYSFAFLRKQTDIKIECTVTSCPLRDKLEWAVLLF